MHLTLCYLYTYTSVSAHSAFGRVSWISPSETGFADRVGVSGDFTTLLIGASRGRSRSITGSVDVTGEIASLRALLYLAVQDREAAQRQTAALRRELKRAQLAGAVLRAEEAQRHLEVRVTEPTKELATLRVRRPPGDQEEVTRLRAELLTQQAVARSLQQIVTDIGRSRSRSRRGASVSRATGASVGQYLTGSSSRRRNEEEERRRYGEGSAQSGRGGGKMLPTPDRQEGSGESGGGH
ncbi:hypothetical protein Taro_032132 [Colocasia esculenta]|uniref:Uncharacterized protein n=1 Tax=Colocasia esculenta TaxID=4460 RepID=A0A843W8I8_COLES|nr:hypothetical protein [Colocasia esculenta]